MKKIGIILTALSLIMMTGCGKVHDPSSANTEETAAVTVEDAIVTTTNGDVNVSLINTRQDESGYVYTMFVSSNDTYAVIKNDCVKYLEDEYKNIQEVKDNIKVTVWNLNDGYTEDVVAFVRLESPEILDLKKVFISVFGTTDYQEGMEFVSVDDYKAEYGVDTLVSLYIQVGESTFDMEALYNASRPIYEGVRLINLGRDYDVVHVSTKNTKSYMEDGTLWTPVDTSYITVEDYSEYFHDVLNNMYIGQGDINGSYEDITIIRDENQIPVLRTIEKDGMLVPEVGIQNYNAETAPNCVIANIILDEESTSLTEEEGRRAIIIFFN